MLNKSIREQRFIKVLQTIKSNNCNNILEIGCGNGSFIPYLKTLDCIKRIVAIDKDEKKIRKLILKYPDIVFLCNSFLNKNFIFDDFDCVVAIEVIEHLEKEELNTFCEIIFGKIEPKLVVFTTPNHDYNKNYPVLYDGFRHPTHIFEFTKNELISWGAFISNNYNSYKFETYDCDNNGSSQMIVFKR